jgi:hypothetical protein
MMAQRGARGGCILRVVMGGIAGIAIVHPTTYIGSGLFFFVGSILYVHRVGVDLLVNARFDGVDGVQEVAEDNMWC